MGNVKKKPKGSGGDRVDLKVPEEDINLIKNAIKEGALIQINASSLTSKGPKEFERVCNDLLKRNMVHFVGTDAHSATRRRPLIRDAYDIVCSKYGESLANDLFELNAQKVLNNEENGGTLHSCPS